MSDTEDQHPELKPLPHPELFDLDAPSDEPAPAPPAESAAAERTAKAPAAPQPTAADRPRWQRFLFAVAALGLYVLLIDVAVESVLHGSPIQWWVTGGVAGFLGLTGLLWKKTGLAMKAGTALLALLALLTVSAWYLPDVGQGLTIALQPPLVVFASATALVIVLAGIALMHMRALPWWDKILIGLIAAYGASSFVLPLFTPMAFPDLLGATGFWEALPFWLQGDFLGVFILLPATLLALFITGVLRVRGRKLWGWAFNVLSIALGLAIALRAFAPLF